MSPMSPTDRAVARLLLIADRRDTPAARDPNAPRVRRYRLARVGLDRGTPAPPSHRHAHLARMYD
jgi:hypothetical protein